MIIDGKKISEMILKQIADDVSKLGEKVTLAIIMVGNNPASQVYVRNKIKACKEAKINVLDYHLEENVTQKELLEIITECNTNFAVHGILVQLPLPRHLDPIAIVNSINPLKDVDGLTIINQGKLLNNLPTIVPATPKGVMTLLQKQFVEISGKHAVVIGRSNLVGKPLALLLLAKNATVTVCHSKTQNLKEITKRADILIAAVGIANFVTADMVKKDAVVIDVGINRVEGKIVGDVNFAEVSEVASMITPVPKGVGPMTIASLLENILECHNFLVHEKEVKDLNHN